MLSPAAIADWVKLPGCDHSLNSLQAQQTHPGQTSSENLNGKLTGEYRSDLHSWQLSTWDPATLLTVASQHLKNRHQEVCLSSSALIETGRPAALIAATPQLGSSPVLSPAVGSLHDLRHQRGGRVIDELLHPVHSLLIIHVQTQFFLRKRPVRRCWLLVVGRSAI